MISFTTVQLAGCRLLGTFVIQRPWVLMPYFGVIGLRASEVMCG